MKGTVCLTAASEQHEYSRCARLQHLSTLPVTGVFQAQSLFCNSSLSSAPTASPSPPSKLPSTAATTLSTIPHSPPTGQIDSYLWSIHNHGKLSTTPGRCKGILYFNCLICSITTTLCPTRYMPHYIRSVDVVVRDVV